MQNNINIIRKLINDTENGIMVWHNEYETNDRLFFISVLNISINKKLIFRFNYDVKTGESFMIIRLMENDKYKIILSITSGNYEYENDMNRLYYMIKQMYID